MSKSYYGARDTTYDSWNSNVLRTWLEEKGVIKTGTQKKKEEFVVFL